MSDLHFHVCESCRHIWAHEKRSGLTAEENATYHRCPSCSAGPYKFGYTTNREALEVRRLLKCDEPSASELETAP